MHKRKRLFTTTLITVLSLSIILISGCGAKDYYPQNHIGWETIYDKSQVNNINKISVKAVNSNSELRIIN